MRALRRVAVLGAGTMGSRIAAQFANAGVPALLLDIVLPNQPDRNAAAKKGIENAAKQNPADFFNPPRYLHLAEIIPGAETDAKVLHFVADFCDRRLGKGAVFCKDTPNFI